MRQIRARVVVTLATGWSLAGHWRTGLSHPIWKLAVLLLSTLRFGNIRIQPAEQPGRYEEK